MAAQSHGRVPTVLAISPLEDDHLHLERILRDAHAGVQPARSCREALEILGHRAIAVVICERDLPDGDWKAILSATRPLEQPPPLIVCSRAADEFLWAEVLNLGGWDVLAKPFEAKEVIWSVGLAWKEWLRRQSAVGGERLAAVH